MIRHKHKKKDFELKLEEEFPFMRQNEVTDEQWEKGGYSTYDAYGCCVSEGWYDILRGLCLEITEAYEAAGLEVDIIVDQVKEKFGRLRFYYHPKGQNRGIQAIDFLGNGSSLRMSPGDTDLHKEISKIVQKWEEKSVTVCERCGIPGELRGDLSWISTLCDSCYDKSKERNEEAKLKREQHQKDLEVTMFWDKIEDLSDEEYITVPEKYKKIGSVAFCKCHKLLEVTIPEWVDHIDDSAFYECYTLKRITVDPNNNNYSDVDGVLYSKDKKRLIKYPAGKESEGFTIDACVESIGDDALKACCFKYMDVDADNPNYASENGVLYNKDKTVLLHYPMKKPETEFKVPNSVISIAEMAFYSQHHLEEIIFPGGLQKIGSSAFENSNLTGIVLPENLGRIYSGAFKNCKKLSGTITISKSIIDMYSDSFSNCNITEILVHPDNPSYKSVEGVLFSKYGTELLTYPAGRKKPIYLIPASVEQIDHNAFDGAENLIKIIVPEGVRSIGVDAFKGCISLAGITLPIVRFNKKERMFYNCKSLEYINILTIDDNESYRSNELKSIDGVLFTGPCKYSRGSKKNDTHVEWIEYILMNMP